MASSPAQAQAAQAAPGPAISLGRPGVGAPTHVCIDTRTTPAWTLMVATDGACSSQDMERLTLSEFQSPAVRGRLRARVLRDALAGSGQDALAQIGSFLIQMPGVPFGLTWEGGIAITYTDYDAAEKSYARFVQEAKR